MNLSDTFNKPTNLSSLGTPVPGPGTYTYTTVDHGQIVTSGGRQVGSFTGGTAGTEAAILDSTTVQGTATIQINNIGGGNALMVRGDSSNNGIILVFTASSTRFFKSTAGTLTGLGSTVSPSVVVGDVIGIIDTGTTLSAIQNGSVIISAFSNTDFNTNTQKGPATSNGGGAWLFYNFYWTDTGTALTAGTLTTGTVTTSSVGLSLATTIGGTIQYHNQLQRSPTGLATWTNIGSVVNGPAPTFTDSTVVSGTTYDYQVVITDSASPTPGTATSNLVTVHVPAILIPADNAAFLYDPGVWNVNTGTHVATCVMGGGGFRVLFTGTACTLSFNLSGISFLPSILIVVDNQTYQLTTLASTISVTMPSNGGTANTHLLEVRLTSVNPNGTRWSGVTSGTTFIGVTLNTGSDTLSAVVPNTYNILMLGDSIVDGQRTVAGPPSEIADSVWSWTCALRSLLNAELGQVGFPGGSYNSPGAGNDPPLYQSYNLIYAGVSRNLSIFDMVIINTGHNDGTSNIVTNALTVVNGILASGSKPVVVLLRPLTNSNQAANLQTVQATCNNPARCFYVNTAGFFDLTQSSDGVHPYGYDGWTQIAPKVASAIMPILHPATSNAATSLIIGG